jgi:putative glutamine amidotransferase
MSITPRQIRIAIPEPTSFDTAYNQRSLPQYLAALHSAGATPILVPLHESPQRIARILSTTAGVLLPGSGADIDPAKYGEARNPLSADPDPARAAADELMIHDAFEHQKPIFAICHGAQELNVYLGGSLIQDIPTQASSPVNHAPEWPSGAAPVLDAHSLAVTPGTRLAALVPADEPRPIQVNSSHHQAIRTPGENLLVSAHSPQDNLIEAVELNAPNHWVLAVQWHPERTYIHSHLSRNLFAAFVHQAESWTREYAQQHQGEPALHA